MAMSGSVTRCVLLIAAMMVVATNAQQIPTLLPTTTLPSAFSTSSASVAPFTGRTQLASDVCMGESNGAVKEFTIANFPHNLGSEFELEFTVDLPSQNDVSRLFGFLFSYTIPSSSKRLFTVFASDQFNGVVVHYRQIDGNTALSFFDGLSLFDDEENNFKIVVTKTSITLMKYGSNGSTEYTKTFSLSKPVHLCQNGETCAAVIGREAPGQDPADPVLIGCVKDIILVVASPTTTKTTTTATVTTTTITTITTTTTITTADDGPFVCTEQDVQNNACICPKNCGTGGCMHSEAYNETICTSCSSGKFLVSGWCTSRFECKADKLINAGDRDKRPCQCEDKNCNQCTRVFGKADKCQACKNNRYKLDSKCLQNCPPGYSLFGEGFFKRRCILAGQCRKGFINVNGVKIDSAPCRCKHASCQTCDFPEGGLGSVTCLTCQAKKFLLDGGCKEDCSEAPAEAIEYIPGRVGRECRAPFTCSEGLDEDGAVCKCKTGCLDCYHGANGHECLKCDKSYKPYRYLDPVTKSCVKNCPNGKTATSHNGDDSNLVCM